MSTGRKDDVGKLRASLFPLSAFWAVIEVLEFGAARYGVENWREVPEGRTRYYDALLRHLTAWYSGERLDPESGKPHLAHALCCGVFLLALDERTE